MTKRLFSFGMCIVLVLGMLFNIGGVQKVQAATAYLDDIAGISAYVKVTTPPTSFITNAKLACDVVELEAALAEGETEPEYFICTVLIDGYAAIYAPHVFVHSDGWIMAYYLEDEPAAKMIDVIAQPLVDTSVPTYPTLLEQAVFAVADAALIIDPIEVSYFDFSNPNATDMLLVAEDKAEDVGLFGDDDHWFTIALPAGAFFEISYGFYQNYYPLFAMDGANFVLSQADYAGPAPAGSIYGELDIADFITGESYLFEVDTFSLAPAGYGALLITYSGAVDPFIIDSADWVEAFELAAPPIGLTDLFDFDFAPAAFGKVDPTDASSQPTSPILSWGESQGATGYEYCIELEGSECDWISTGTATSVTLSGLPYNATYSWQVRAVNEYETTEADDGTWWSFDTPTGVPAIFGKVSPANGSTGVATNPLLDWADADGAEYYEYCVTISTSTCDVEDWINIGLVSQAVVDLPLDLATEYAWQVRAVNSAGVTDADSGFWSFTTIQEGFGKVSPIDGTAGVDPKATLLWGDMLGATGYQYCIDTSLNNTCNGQWVSLVGTTATLKGLKYLTTYQWQVRAVTPTGTIEADNATWWTFITRDRKAPIKQTPSFDKSSPEDGATNLAVENLILDWDDVAKATSYEYCLDTTDDDKCITWIKTDTSQVTLELLPFSTTYYWQVRATVAGIVGYADGGYWSFTTMAEPEAIP